MNQSPSTTRILGLALVLGAVSLIAPIDVRAEFPDPSYAEIKRDRQPIVIERGRRAATVPRRLDMERGRSSLIKTNYQISRLAVGDPEIVDFVLLDEQEIQLVAKTVGDTNLLIWEAGRLQAMIDIHVGTVHGHMVEEMRRILDNPSIEVDMAGNSIVLKGVVPTLDAYEQASRVAQAFITGSKSRKEKAEVINLLRVGGDQQVMIEIIIAEMRKSFRHAFGVNLMAAIAIDDQKAATFQTLLRNMTSNPEIAIAPGSPSGMTQMTEAVSLAGTMFSNESFDVRLFMEAVEANALGSILAEPTVIARSGELANFLVGGEVPIPLINALDVAGPSYSIDFKKFGVSVEFLPTVLSEDNIHMQITSEVSEPDFSYGVRVLGSSVPAFQTRRVTTGVELGDGQTFIVAGLLREDIITDIESIPGLGGLPILGNLFRSRQFQKNLTELVMVITPRLVKPVPPGPIELPTDHYIEPTRAEFYFHGLITGRSDERLADEYYESEGDDNFVYERDFEVPLESATEPIPHEETAPKPATPEAGDSGGASWDSASNNPVGRRHVTRNIDGQKHDIEVINGGLTGRFGQRLEVPTPTGGVQ